MYKNVKQHPYFTNLCLSNYNKCVQRIIQTSIENYVPCVCVRVLINLLNAKNKTNETK